MSATPCTNEHKKSCAVRFAGQRFRLHADGALYWEDADALLFADLHFEKGSFLATHGSALPCYDTAETLLRMERAIARFAPKRVVCLGDSFHDRQAVMRIRPADAAHLRSLVERVGQWQWITGNHDPLLPADIPGERHGQLVHDGIVLSHERVAGESPQIIGHYHPKLVLHIGGQRVSGRSLLHDGRLMVMPAFGAYTGGLDAAHPELAGLFAPPVASYLLYRGKVWSLR